MTFELIDDTSAIVSPKSDAQSDSSVYALNGQRVGSSLEGLPHGLYIMNGRKVIR